MFIQIWVRKGVDCSDYSFLSMSRLNFSWYYHMPWETHLDDLSHLASQAPSFCLGWSNVRHWQQIGVKEEKEVGVFIPHFFLVLLQFYVVCSPLWPQSLNYFPLTLFIIRDQAQHFLLLTFQAEGCYASLLL